MGSFSIWHLVVIMVIIFVLFGAGKLPKVMGDVGKGIRSLKEGLKEDDKKTFPVIRNRISWIVDRESWKYIHQPLTTNHHA